MKTYKNLFDEIATFENLMKAEEQAAKEKRHRDEVIQFEARRAEHCRRLAEELQAGTYKVGPYYIFWIRRPVRRMAMALQYRDRVVQWGIYQVAFPLFDRSFIYDSYACRKGKGSHKALDRLQYWMRKAERAGKAYTLKLDVSKYFYRIEHDKLLEIVGRKVKDERLMRLFDQIVNSKSTRFGLPPGKGPDDVPPEERLEDVGVPIGNLTSQMFANIYLNELDQFVKHKLRLHWYIRYMDDIIIIGKDKKELVRIWTAIDKYLREELHLMLNGKSGISPLRQGVEFVGMQVWPTHRRLRHRTIRGMKQRLDHVVRMYEAGEMGAEAVERTFSSYRGVLSHCECATLRHKLNQKYGKFYAMRKERGRIEQQPTC